MHVLLCLGLLLYLTQAQVMLSINKIQTIQVTGPTFIYTDNAIIQVTATDAVCGSSITFDYTLDHAGTATLIAAESAQVALTDNSTGFPTTTISVLWCATFMPPAPYASASFSSTNPPTTLGSINQGTCQQDFTRLGQTTTGFISITLGARHASAVHKSGKIYSWGSNDHCQLGTLLSSPNPVTDLTPYPWFQDFIAPVISLQFITCALRSNKDLICWGSPTRNAVPEGTDCANYTNARFAIAGVDSFGVTENIIIARLDDQTIVLTGISETLIMPGNHLYVITPSFTPIPAANIWSNYPSVLFTIAPNQYMISKVVGGSNDVIQIWSNPQTLGVFIGLSTCPFIDPYLPFSSYTQTGGSVGMPFVANVCVFDSQSNIGFTTNKYVYTSMFNGTDTDDIDIPDPPVFQVDIQANTYTQITNLPTSDYSTGVDTLCFSVNNTAFWCLSNNISGDVPFNTTAPERADSTWLFKSVQSNVIMVAGGNNRCILFKINGTIACSGKFGNGVLQVNSVNGYPTLIIGPMDYTDNYILSGTVSETVTTDHGITISGMPGCFQPLTVSYNSTNTTVYATTQKHRYQIAPGVCFEVLSCVDQDWKVDYGQFPSLIVKVVTGAFHTCLLTSTGQVLCAGRNVECQFIPFNYSDSRLFSQIWTGSFFTAGDVYAHGNITCVVSLQRTSISCTGMFGQYSLCTRNPLTTLSLVGSTIISVGINATAACIAIRNTLTSAITFQCIGVNINGVLGYAPIPSGMMWKYCKNSNGNTLSIQSQLTPLFAFNMYSTIIFCSGLYYFWATSTNTPYFIVSNFSSSDTPIDIVTGWTGIYKTANNDTFLEMDQVQSNGQLGTISALWPPQGDFTALSSNSNVRVCALISNGAFVCPYINNNLNTIIPVLGVSVIQVAAGVNHTAILTTDNKVCIAGSNQFGQCGRLYTNYSSNQFVCISAATPYWPHSIISTTTPIILQEVPSGEINPAYLVSFTGALLVLFIVIIAFVSVFAISATDRLRYADKLLLNSRV